MISAILSLALAISATSNPDSPASKPAKPKKVCQKIEMTGSSVPKRVCRTVTEPAKPKDKDEAEQATSEEPAAAKTN